MTADDAPTRSLTFHPATIVPPDVPVGFSAVAVDVVPATPAVMSSAVNGAAVVVAVEALRIDIVVGITFVDALLLIGVLLTLLDAGTMTTLVEGAAAAAEADDGVVAVLAATAGVVDDEAAAGVVAVVALTGVVCEEAAAASVVVPPTALLLPLQLGWPFVVEQVSPVAVHQYKNDKEKRGVSWTTRRLRLEQKGRLTTAEGRVGAGDVVRIRACGRGRGAGLAGWAAAGHAVDRVARIPFRDQGSA